MTIAINLFRAAAAAEEVLRTQLRHDVGRVVAMGTMMVVVARLVANGNVACVDRKAIHDRSVHDKINMIINELFALSDICLSLGKRIIVLFDSELFRFIFVQYIAYNIYE